MNWEQDGQYEQHEITSVEGTGPWSIGFDGCGIYVPNEECQEAPQVGELARLYGRGFGYTVRGIVIGARVYRYETPEQHEASQDAMRDRLRREREEQDAALRAAPKRALPAFAVTDAEGWTKCVKTNEADPYSFRCVEYAATWAALMEHFPEKPVAEIAQECATKADTDGITGFMYGAAVSMLAKFWVRGEELRRWHNKETQLGDEGDRANETGGVLNPALLNVGG